MRRALAAVAAGVALNAAMPVVSHLRFEREPARSVVTFVDSVVTPRARRVLAMREAERRGDTRAVTAAFAPDSRVWYEAREGPGEPRDASGKDSFGDWDRYFHARKGMEYEAEDGDSVTFDLTESNDFYRLLDRPPSHTRLVYWFDDQERITGTLVQGVHAWPGAPAPRNRLPEFKAWMAARDSSALADLLPGGHLAHDLAHAKRWRKALVAWRRAAGLPAVTLEAP